jgi:hypothetical protein
MLLPLAEGLSVVRFKFFMSPKAVLRFFSNPDPESRVKKISDPGSGSASKNLSVLTPKIYS